MNIRMKFTLAALVAALLPLGGYFYISYDESKKQVESQVRASFEEGTAIGTQRLDDWFATNASTLKRAAKIPNLMKMENPAAKAELQNNIKPYSWIRVAVATDATGMQTLRSDTDKPVAVGDRPYYKGAKEKGLGAQVIMSRVTNKPSFFIAAPLAPETGTDGGVLALGIDLDKISQSVVAKAAIAGASDGVSVAAERRFVAFDDGKLMAHSDPKAVVAPKAGELPDATKHPLWAARPQVAGEFKMASYELNGQSWVGAIKKSNLGWYMAVELPASEVEKPLEEMQQRALAAFGAAAVFAALVAFLAGGLLARPIRVLTAVTENIAAGKFDEAGLADIRSKDEIGALAQSIKRLSSSVKIAMEALARK